MAVASISAAFAAPMAASAAPVSGSGAHSSQVTAQAGASLPSLPRVSPGSSIAGVAPLTTGGGFWIVSSSGVVKAVGSAVFHGDMSGTHLNEPIVGIAATHDGGGYWLVGADGGIFSFGDAHFYGSTGSKHLNAPVISMASTSDSRGYWLLGSDGGIFGFGDATFHGSTGSMHLNQPVEAMAPSPDGRGYWLVARDGGIFSFGDARFYGSTGSMHLTSSVTAMASSSDGKGYWLVSASGGVYAFGDAPFRGSATASTGGAEADGIVRSAGNGYWIVLSSGAVLSYGAPKLPTDLTPSSSKAPAGPLASIAPSAAFNADCVQGGGGATCDKVALSEIDSARAAEGLGALVLPANFESLATGSQSIVVADAERTSRGLPSLPENSSLDVIAQKGAVQGVDPTGPAGYAWGSNAAYGYRTPLAADYVWMYDDGIGSDNVDCTATTTSGCWGHRDNILSPWSGAAGAGTYNNHGELQLTQLFVESY